MKIYSSAPLAVLFAALLWWLGGSAALRESVVAGGGEVAHAEARRILRRLEGKNLLALNLRALRAELSNLPGVADAELRRRLPGVLEAKLIARTPLAAWGGGGLVDVRGRRYDGAAYAWLPIFHGPAGLAAGMADFYGAAREILAPLNTAIVQLQAGGDGEWRVFLRDGVVLYLGRENRRLRLRRYARHARRLRREFAALRSVDLRYEKGFSVTGERAEEEV
ncbi:MAG: FtsQ-type POTRA domain-containing protein [Betaproteobacteria bacterium]|nr:FtsQ-type POTRA domain-containing protein [Betaproteobacteria bacterium]